MVFTNGANFSTASLATNKIVTPHYPCANRGPCLACAPDWPGRNLTVTDGDTRSTTVGLDLSFEFRQWRTPTGTVGQ
jgi:hypothetical protein